MALQLTPEQLQVLQQLTNAYQAQQEQIASLQHEVHQLHVPASAAAASVSSPSESASIHRDDSHFGLNRLLSKPSVFHGEHGNRVLDWINEFDILFENCDPHMPESRKITFAKHVFAASRTQEHTSTANLHHVAFMQGYYCIDEQIQL